MPRPHSFEDPDFDSLQPLANPAVFPHEATAPTSALAQAVRRHEASLLSIAGVKSVGETRNAIGDDAIEVGVVADYVTRKIPKKLDKYDVVVRVVGEVEAY